MAQKAGGSSPLTHPIPLTEGGFQMDAELVAADYEYSGIRKVKKFRTGAPVLSLRTVIEAGEIDIKTKHLPFRIPLTSRVPTRDIRMIDIESVITDRNENRPVCVFNVVASMNNTHWRPLIFTTQDQAQAVFINEILNEYLAQAGNFFGIAIDMPPDDSQ